MGIDPAVRFARTAAELEAAERDLGIYFGKNAEKYRRYWRHLMVPKEHRPKSRLFLGSLHWPAFFVFLPWAFYRRLYWQSMAYFVFTATVILALPDDAPVSTPLAIAGSALAYPTAIWTARRKIRKIRESDAPVEEQDAGIRQAGRTSVVGAIVGSSLLVVILAAAVVGTIAERESAKAARTHSSSTIGDEPAIGDGVPVWAKVDRIG